MPNVSLTPELERFAESCVESGRYNSISEVTRAGLRLLQQIETQRREFVSMLERVEAEGEREGFSSVEDVEAELGAVIEATRRTT